MYAIGQNKNNCRPRPLGAYTAKQQVWSKQPLPVRDLRGPRKPYKVMQIKGFILRTPVKLPRPLMAWMFEKLPSTWQVWCVPFWQCNDRISSCTPTEQWGRHGSSDPRRELNFCCKYFKMQKSSGIDSLITEHMQMSKEPKICHHTYRAHGWINHAWAPPSHWDNSSPIQSQKRGLQEDLPKETEEINTYGTGINPT